MTVKVRYGTVNGILAVVYRQQALRRGYQSARCRMFPDLSYRSIYGAFLAVPLDEIVDAFRLLILANEAHSSGNGAGILPSELMQNVPERPEPAYAAPSQLFASFD